MSNAAIYTRNIYNWSSTILLKDNSTIYLINSTSHVLYGYVKEYNDIVIDGYTYINNSNTFNNFTVLPGSELELGSGQTQTVNQFTADGSKFAVIDIQPIMEEIRTGIYMPPHPAIITG